MEDLLMKYFKDEQCQVCLQKFKEGDKIVVCPECGDPYHKACYDKVGKCLHDEDHGEYFYTNDKIENIKNQTYKNSSINKEENKENQKICLFCNEAHDQDETVCQNCGMPLDVDINKLIFSKDKLIGEGKLEGIDIKYWMSYLGSNALSYIMKFKSIGQKKQFNMEFNFSAFLFGEFYFWYRKMYLTGVLFFILNLVLRALVLVLCLPRNLLQEFITRDWSGFVFQIIGNNLSEQHNIIMNKFIMFINQNPQVYGYTVFAMFILAFIRGMIATKIYKKISVKKINAIDRDLYPSEIEYKNVLAQKGSVNYIAVIIMVVISLLFMM